MSETPPQEFESAKFKEPDDPGVEVVPPIGETGTAETEIVKDVEHEVVKPGVDDLVRTRLREELQSRLASRRIVDVNTTGLADLFQTHEPKPISTTADGAVTTSVSVRLFPTVTELVVKLRLTDAEANTVSSNQAVVGKIRLAAIVAARAEDHLVLFGTGDNSADGLVREPAHQGDAVKVHQIPHAVTNAIARLHAEGNTGKPTVVVPRSLIPRLTGSGPTAIAWRALVTGEVVYTDGDRIVVLIRKAGASMLYPVDEWTLSVQASDGARTYTMKAALAFVAREPRAAVEIFFELPG